MSNRRSRFWTILNRGTATLDESVDRLNLSLEMTDLDQSNNISNICLSSLENPSVSKVCHHQLLSQIEKEFDSLLLENITLRKELKQSSRINNNVHETTINKLRVVNIFPMIRNRIILRTRNQSSDLLFSSNNHHRDVIWDVQVGGFDNQYFVSASADKTSIIWSRKTFRPLIQYQGHRGSVNSCRFQCFDHDLVLTASGDHELHIWKLSLYDNEDEQDQENEMTPLILRNPILALRGDDVLSCADWLQRDQIVSASWNRSATIWQVETGSSLRTLYGHNAELTHVSCHQTKPFVITASHDGTFRLWDCRTSSHSVQIFNGHTKTVNSTLFIGDVRLVSSSDDGFVHMWDFRSTSSSPILSLECISPCNRLSISNDILAVPLDNRDIHLYSIINGKKLYVQRQAHKRSVQCTAFVQCTNSMEFLLVSGSLDCHMHIWHIKKLKETNNNKLMKSIEESIEPSSEIIKNGNSGEGQYKKESTNRISLSEKPNNINSMIEKKQSLTCSNATSDKPL